MKLKFKNVTISQVVQLHVRNVEITLICLSTEFEQQQHKANAVVTRESNSRLVFSLQAHLSIICQ